MLWKLFFLAIVLFSLLAVTPISAQAQSSYTMHGPITGTTYDYTIKDANGNVVGYLSSPGSPIPNYGTWDSNPSSQLYHIAFIGFIGGTYFYNLFYPNDVVLVGTINASVAMPLSGSWSVLDD